MRNPPTPTTRASCLPFTSFLDPTPPGTSWNQAVPSLCWWLLGPWTLETKGKLSIVTSLRKRTKFMLLGSLAILQGPTEPKGDFLWVSRKGKVPLAIFSLWGPTTNLP